MLFGGVRLYERFIARQPIFDGRLKLFAYELLFRGGPQNVFQPRKDASSSVIVDSTMLFDLQTLTGRAKAFINADESALLQGAVKLLPVGRIVVEILESVAPTPDIVDACADLHACGYILALDDFVDHPKWQPLMPFAKFLKVDFRLSGQEARREMARRYRPKGLQLLAEKVETQAELEQARALGYSYFQGYFFSKPTMVEARNIPGNKLNYLRLLETVNTADLRLERVEEVLKQEPSLVYKLLRYINSPVFALRKEVRSIRQAIFLIGEKEFRRWVSIVALVSLAGDKPPELIRTALTRAYFCEEISQPIRMTPHASDLFLMGLLSMTDAILDMPMNSVLSHLPLSAEVCTALSGGANSFREVYDTLLSYEQADWQKLSSQAAKIGTSEYCVPKCYLSAAKRAAMVTI
jgi:EAL and modified HD-GYP domain-containing signal transduction protein